MPNIPSSVSGDLRDFLQRCLEVNEQERWTAESLLSHSFISNTGGEKLDENKNPNSKVSCERLCFEMMKPLRCGRKRKVESMVYGCGKEELLLHVCGKDEEKSVFWWFGVTQKHCGVW